MCGLNTGPASHILLPAHSSCHLLPCHLILSHARIRSHAHSLSCSQAARHWKHLVPPGVPCALQHYDGMNVLRHPSDCVCPHSVREQQADRNEDFQPMVLHSPTSSVPVVSRLRLELENHRKYMFSSFPGLQKLGLAMFGGSKTSPNRL